MTRRRLILLVIGFVLLVLGASSIVYGSLLPPNIVVQNWALRTYNVNILMLIGVPPVCVGVALLLFLLFTRSKPSSISS